jgi:hypothetical protein
VTLGLHDDDPSGPGYLELEVGVARDGHELDVSWSSQDNVIRVGEIDDLEHEHFNVVVSHISEGDR